MSEKLQSLLSELEVLKTKIQQQVEFENTPRIVYKSMIVSHTDKELYRKSIDYHKKYLLITLTFCSKFVINYDYCGQFTKLNDCINAFNGLYQYYACMEKHKSGILHSHILISIDYHEVQPILQKIRKNLTRSIKLEPAINCKPVKDSVRDVNRSYDYIFDDKPDHPVYKYIKINI